MNAGLFQQRLSDMKTWSRRHERAPHKPLLLLLAFGHVRRGSPRLRPYKVVEYELRKLLFDFGPPRKTQHPEQPLFRDGLWELRGLQPPHFNALGQLRPHLVRESAVMAGLPREIHDFLIAHPFELDQAVLYLLYRDFSDGMHADLLAAVNLDDLLLPMSQREGNALLTTRPRDPYFRPKVIRAYNHQCAVCGYDIRMQDQLMGLDASHILWHTNGGPDEISNGLALCAIHRRAFDRGGISLGINLELLVSSAIRGQGEAWNYWFERLKGRSIKAPQEIRHFPDSRFLQWHRSQVFRGVY